MRYEKVRQVFEQFANPQDSRETQLAGAYRFVEHFRNDLGLTTNENGRPCVRDAKMKPSEFSFRGLAESLCGYAWVQNLEQSTSHAFQVFEAGGNPAISPGNLPNVSAFLGSVSGLLDAAILQGYEKPEYIIDKLIYTLPSKTRQKKLIGAGRIGDQAKRRNPGEGHAFAQFGDRVVTTSETQNDALACAVTFEAVFFDQTSEVLERANSVGDELALRKELDGFRLIAGVNNPYNYNGVAYNTYLTSGNWINDVASNPLVDWTNIDVANALASRFTDQETGNRITTNFDVALVSPAKAWTAKHIQHATEVESRTQSAAEIRRGAYLGDKYNLQHSNYLDQVLTAAAADGGLALSQANADKYWWLLKTGPDGAFVRTENWGITINRAAPDSFSMLNQKLLLAVFSDQMHAFDVREPRRVVRSKN
jgi:hypothetical protein